MGLTSYSVLDAPTSFTVVGGTALSFQLTGEPVVSGVVTADTAATDHRLRQKQIFRTKTAQSQPDGTYSKEKRFVTKKVPHLCADGVVRFNVYRYESEVYPETIVATAKSERLTFAQVIFDSELDGFHDVGSLS